VLRIELSAVAKVAFSIVDHTADPKLSQKKRQDLFGGDESLPDLPGEGP
jgi:hypothetical protein